MRKDCLLIWGLLLLVIIEAIIFFLPMKISISDRIQAGSIVALVFVTVYYAIQTKELAQEQKKALREITNKRNIDFLERRLKEFYGPFLDYFDGIISRIEYGPNISIDAEKHFKSFYALVRDKEYMVSEEMRKKIHHMIPVLQKARDYASGSKEIKDSFLDHAKELERELINEREKIVNQVKEFYRILER